MTFAVNQMALADVYFLKEENKLPANIAFKIVGGRIIYKYIGWMWRNSDKQIYLNNYDLFDYQEEKYRR